MKKTMVSLAALTLSGCGGDLTDPTATAVPAPSIRGTPEEQREPAMPSAYRSADRRSPFQPLAWRSMAPWPCSRISGAPRRRSSISRLRELRMVGTLAGRGIARVLIRDPQGRVHALRTGDYLGSDYGRIEAVGTAGVDLIEMVRDGNGGWMQRARTLALSSERDLTTSAILRPSAIVRSRVPTTEAAMIRSSLACAAVLALASCLAAGAAETDGAAVAQPYRGEPLSLDFQDVEVRGALQLIADFAGINLVAGDALPGVSRCVSRMCLGTRRWTSCSPRTAWTSGAPATCCWSRRLPSSRPAIKPSWRIARH